METQIQKPVLITLTAPTCAGKSYLLSHIRDTVGLPCFVSTTTRNPRRGEREGVDYYFISEDESRAIEERDGFAELAIFRGFRYGVTKEEFNRKLSKGIAFLIVEPTGIDHYAKPALDAGAAWLKYFVDVHTETRVERFKKRFFADVNDAISQMILEDNTSLYGDNKGTVLKVVRNYTDRLIHMLGPEIEWRTMVEWDGYLDGTALPSENLAMILRDVDSLQESLKRT